MGLRCRNRLIVLPSGWLPRWVSARGLSALGELALGVLARRVLALGGLALGVLARRVLALGGLALVGLALAAQGCAALGGGGGGGENLPNRGIVPWTPVQVAGEPTQVTPFVLVPGPGEELREPWAVEADEGEAIELLYERRLSDGTSIIERVISEDQGVSFGAPERLLEPSDGPAWLEGRVGAPSLARQPQTWLLAFEYGAGAGIGLAWSLDGRHFEIAPDPLLRRTGAGESGGVGSPSLLITEAGFELYYQASAGASGSTSILRAVAGSDLVFERAGVVLGPGVGCTEPDGQPEDCWDADGAAAPEVRLAYTTTGRALRRLFYTGDGPGKEQVGFAASWDGEIWSRFEFNPVLVTEDRTRQATTLDRGDHYLMYFVDRRSAAAQGIGVAVNGTGHTSERLD